MNGIQRKTAQNGAENVPKHVRNARDFTAWTVTNAQSMLTEHPRAFVPANRTGKTSVCVPCI